MVKPVGMKTPGDPLTLDVVHASRRAAYPPIGDQLDAIWKSLNLMQLQGVFNLPSDADLINNRILAVKAKFPKPEE